MRHGGAGRHPSSGHCVTSGGHAEGWVVLGSVRCPPDLGGWPGLNLVWGGERIVGSAVVLGTI